MPTSSRRSTARTSRPSSRTARRSARASTRSSSASSSCSTSTWRSARCCCTTRRSSSAATSTSASSGCSPARSTATTRRRRAAASAGRARRPAPTTLHRRRHRARARPLRPGDRQGAGARPRPAPVDVRRDQAGVPRARAAAQPAAVQRAVEADGVVDPLGRPQPAALGQGHGDPDGAGQDAPLRADVQMRQVRRPLQGAGRHGAAPPDGDAARVRRREPRPEEVRRHQVRRARARRPRPAAHQVQRLPGGAHPGAGAPAHRGLDPALDHDRAAGRPGRPLQGGRRRDDRRAAAQAVEAAAARPARRGRDGDRGGTSASTTRSAAPTPSARIWPPTLRSTGPSTRTSRCARATGCSAGVPRRSPTCTSSSSHWRSA